MHRAYNFILVALLVVALAIPVCASESSTVQGVVVLNDTIEALGPGQNMSEDITFVSNNTTYRSIYQNFSNGTPKLAYFLPDTGFVTVYENGAWVDTAYKTIDFGSAPIEVYPGLVEWITLNSKVTPKECDGTSCPANDFNHDNICDDCGNVLTMSLRSTLLDYARTVAENNDAGYNYWAIFQIDNQYRVYISSTPMSSADGVIVTGTDFKYALVYELANGSFSYGSWYTGFDIDALTFVEANHTIENFLRAPLAVTVQGVTGEPMEMEIPSLYPTMRILALCGVGCLALLIGLNLLRKKSLIFPR